MYGIQTARELITDEVKFENDVKMYGIQTHSLYINKYQRLRMM